MPVTTRSRANKSMVGVKPKVAKAKTAVGSASKKVTKAKKHLKQARDKTPPAQRSPAQKQKIARAARAEARAKKALEQAKSAKEAAVSAKNRGSPKVAKHKAAKAVSKAKVAKKAAEVANASAQAAKALMPSTSSGRKHHKKHHKRQRKSSKSSRRAQRRKRIHKRMKRYSSLSSKTRNRMFRRIVRRITRNYKHGIGEHSHMRSPPGATGHHVYKPKTGYHMFVRSFARRQRKAGEKFLIKDAAAEWKSLDAAQKRRYVHRAKHHARRHMSISFKGKRASYFAKRAKAKGYKIHKGLTAYQYFLKAHARKLRQQKRKVSIKTLAKSWKHAKKSMWAEKAAEYNRRHTRISVSFKHRPKKQRRRKFNSLAEAISRKV